MSHMRPTQERLQSAIQSNEMTAMRHTGHKGQKVGIRPFKAVGAQEGFGREQSGHRRVLGGSSRGTGGFWEVVREGAMHAPGFE